MRFERFVLKSTFNQQANYLLGLLNTNYTNYTNKLLEDERFVRFERFVFKINIQHSTFNIIKKMDLRSYTKQELALLYFPDSDPDVARAHLMRWIVRCTQLYEQLLKSGYTKNSKEFNPLQVSYIFFHLGEPWYLSVIIGEYRWATMSIGELGKWNVVSLHCDSERRTLTI